MEKVINSLRVAYENWVDGTRFDEILALLQKYPCAIGQVALFSQSFHSPLPVGELERRAEIMASRLEQIRGAGLSGGINLLCTIGHHNENLQNALHCGANRMTNIDGDICQGSYCIRDERYHKAYIVPVYTALAKAAPDFIWVDDDVRYGHMPVGNGCFCDLCVNAFNEKHGYDFTRRTLKEALNGDDAALRLRWLEHNGGAISSLLSLIGRTVRSVDEKITLGFMTGERYFEGYDFPAFADALSEGGRYEIMWRPGGGAYTDYSMEQFTDKMREIGRQNAFLPPYVSVVQSEIENFPYQLIKKSPISTASEAALYMTAGCTGAAFNILPSETGEPVDNCGEHLKAIDGYVGIYTMLHEKLHGMKPVGIGTGWKPTAQAYTQGGEWTSSYPSQAVSYARELFGFGLPECFDGGAAVCMTLCGFTASMLTDDEALRLLSHGVYMDADALDILDGRGFSAYTGYKTAGGIAADAIEQYTDVPLNIGIAGGKRNCRQAFNYGMSKTFEPTASETVSLCRIVDYTGAVTADYSLGVYENSLGGRVAVGGYYPFSWISDAYKTAQLKRLFKYLSRDKLPSYVDSCIRVRNMTFTGGGRVCVTLYNPNHDTLRGVKVCVPTDKKRAILYYGKSSVNLDAASNTGGYAAYTVPEIAPLGVVLLEI